jgi:hypothetical protein
LNAVEHGNLGISYVDKGKLIENDTWRMEIERRLSLPENPERRMKSRPNFRNDYPDQPEQKRVGVEHRRPVRPQPEQMLLLVYSWFMLSRASSRRSLALR